MNLSIKMQSGIEKVFWIKTLSTPSLRSILAFIGNENRVILSVKLVKKSSRFEAPTTMRVLLSKM